MKTKRAETETYTPVIFRVWRDKGGGVEAVFPTIAADTYGHQCQCYAHVGRHSGGDYHTVMARTRRATAEEYADLLVELIGMGYTDLKVFKRARHSWHRARMDGAIADLQKLQNEV